MYQQYVFVEKEEKYVLNITLSGVINRLTFYLALTVLVTDTALPCWSTTDR